jgi:uncharacterized membrane protein YhdT
MAYTYEMPNLTNGLDDALTSLATSIPSFVPMLLLFIYLVVMIGGSIAQKNRTGFSDLPLWSLLGSISSLMIALAFSIGTNIINPVVLTIVVTITIANGIWFFLDTNRNEALT